MSAPKPCKCTQCNQCFESKSSMYRHRIAAHGPAKNMKKPYSWICPICKSVLKTSGDLRKHRINEHGKYAYAPRDKAIHDRRWNGTDWICQYCHAKFNSRRQLLKHYNNCIVKASLPVNSLGRVYLPEYTRKAAMVHKQRMAAGLTTRKPCSETTRRKLSDARKKNIANGKGSSTWINPSLHRSYAEQYFYDILIQKLNSTVKWENNYRVGRYLLDFANLDTKVYFEVDGEQHYDEDGLKHDEIRTKTLADRGWFLMTRIRWKSFKHISRDEQEEYIDTLIKNFRSPDTNIIPALPEVRTEPTVTSYKFSPYPDKSTREMERQIKIDEARRNGLLRKDGRINGVGVPLDEWDRRKNLIMNCGVDLMKFGWKAKVMEQTGLTIRILADTISRFPDDFAGKCYRRQSPT